MTGPTVPETADDHRAVPSAFARALAREAHVLTAQPDLLWTQLFNRLQWEGDALQAVLAPQLARRSAPRASP